MAQDEKSTQPEVPAKAEDQAQNSSSTQPEVKRPPHLDTEDAKVEKEAPPQEVQEKEAEKPAETEERSQESNDKLIELMQEQKTTIEDLKKGLYNQGRKIATEETEEGEELTDDEVVAKQKITDMGFINESTLKAELEAINKKQEDGKSLDGICNANPKIDRKLLEALGKSEPDKAWEDIVEHYNLNGGEALLKAQDRPVVGMPISKEPPAEKSVKQMTKMEFDDYIKSKSSGTMHTRYI